MTMQKLEPPFGVYVNTEIGDKNGHVCTAENLEIAADIVAALSIVGLIEGLRADEGDSVTVLCDNPAAGPANAIECCGEWTDWKDKRFTGSSLVEVLSAAWLERFQREAATAHGRDEAAKRGPKGLYRDMLDASDTRDA